MPKQISSKYNFLIILFRTITSVRTQTRDLIAYHADDDKIFFEGGVGTEFGPRCSIQDVLGCGITFPVKYGDLPTR